MFSTARSACKPSTSYSSPLGECPKSEPFLVSNHRLVESGVTIMCSSILALTSLSRTLTAHSKYYTELRDRVSRRYDQPALPSKVSLSKISILTFKPDLDYLYYNAGGGSCDKGYIKLSGRQPAKTKYVDTLVYVGVKADHDNVVKSAIITKSVCIYQSSDRNSFTTT